MIDIPDDDPDLEDVSEDDVCPDTSFFFNDMDTEELEDFFDD